MNYECLSGNFWTVIFPASLWAVLSDKQQVQSLFRLFQRGLEAWSNLISSSGSPHSQGLGGRSGSRGAQDLLRGFPERVESPKGEISVIKSVQPKVETLTQPKFHESAPPSGVSPSSVIVPQQTRGRSQSATVAAMVKNSAEDEAGGGGVAAEGKKPKKKSPAREANSNTIIV
jgi:hypothetical protein